ncbi:rhamnogalacturonate lyase-like [Belonocnema kinseyi]|uniref:rhamnogalacturonate lyase-like n=1 Tax=Belonocnema kinseyi TaxID=2817044 RepID=UPI00143D2F0C|nr:rhamnogalacturonate lyase-like [Belonocnema kinseyi]
MPGFLKYQYHIIMEKGISGIYNYEKVTNNKDQPLTFGATSTVYRFNPRTMNQATNSVQQGILSNNDELMNSRLVQDTTWQLADSTYYTKYDYAGYIRNSPYVRVFGNGCGAWLISASREYHSDCPLKQDLLVHQDALIANYMTEGHFATPAVTAPVGWSKIYGPWLLYFNEGMDDEMRADAIRQSKMEQDHWPYKWMNETCYPLKRGELRGQIASPIRSMVVLSSSLTEEFDRQTFGFSYPTETNVNGDFKPNRIRPGTYKLTTYPIEGYGIGFQSEKLINITQGKNRVTVDLSVPTEVKWSIGETNRRSGSYQYCNEERSYIWHTLPPADLQFEIGKCEIHTDWYYAQTKPGAWTIRYKDSLNGKNRVLRIGIAAPSYNKGSPILAVDVNDNLINEFHYRNDQSIYRSAPQSGNFHSENIIIPGDLVTEGDNLISLTIRQGSVMYDSINLSDNQF